MSDLELLFTGLLAIAGIVIAILVISAIFSINKRLGQLVEILYTHEPWGIGTKLSNLTTIAATQSNQNSQQKSNEVTR